MPSTQISNFERRVNRYGLPIVYLGLTLTGVISVVMWAKPKLDKGFDKHIELIDTLQKTSTEQSTYYGKIAEDTRQLSSIAASQERKLDAIHRIIRDRNGKQNGNETKAADTTNETDGDEK